VSDAIGLLAPGILLAAPILYAALGGLFTQRTGIFNIALEGFMLIAAYFSVSAAVSTGSLLWGTVAGIGSAILTAALMAVVVVGFKADEVIVGIAINVFALGLTTFLLASSQNSGRQLELPQGYPRLHLPWLTDVPVLGAVFDDRDLLVWALLPATLVVAYIFRRTGFGLRLKAVGEAPMAARAAGVRVASVRFTAILISGALSGVAGAELALGSVHLFSENMTSGRGIIAFAAVIFGAGRVGRTAVACLLFGYAQALAGLLQIRTDFPPQFVLMVPYLLTILAIILSDVLRRGGAGDDIHLAGGDVLPDTPGGAAGYAALGAFLAGGRARVLARVGDDYPLDRLRLDHPVGGTIDAAAIRAVGPRSIHNVAHYGADGSRHFDIESRATLVDQTPVPADLSGVPDLAGRWSLVAPAVLEQQEALVDALLAAGARVALDTEIHYLTTPEDRDRLRALTRRADCFLPSIEHLRLVSGLDLPPDPDALRETVADLGCPLTVVKCGRDGAIVFTVGDPTGVTVPAVPGIEVVDPTGAGDGFNGGFVVGVSHGEGPTVAAITGTVAASFVIEAVGVAIPPTFSDEAREARRKRCTEEIRPSTERQGIV
jgi:ABC-type uncharacterized transport system permease subunit/sugar/nucleoside kinase (ribokinase family)